MSPNPTPTVHYQSGWWAVFASTDLLDIHMTDGPFCDREFVERLYQERLDSGEYRRVYLVKIEKGLL